MHLRPTARRALRLVAALPLLVPLALAAPAGASPSSSPGAVTAPARTTLLAHLKTLRHNDLLKDTLAEDGGDGDGDQAALCQTYNGSGSNPYAPLGRNVDLIGNDRRTQAGSGTGCYTAQNETAVAVNPENPKNLVAGSNDYRRYNPREGRNDGSGFAYTSMDGGKTWKNVLLPGLTVMTGAQGALQDMDSAGDPAISFGPHNQVYYANIVFSRLNTGNAITVNRSDDGGLTWGAPVLVRLDGAGPDGSAQPTRFFNDKVWIGADPGSRKVYVTWTRFTYTDASQESYVASPIVVSTSSDNGQTFSGMRPVGPAAGQVVDGVAPFGQGSFPQVGRDGALYVAFEGTVCKRLACDAASDHDAVVVATSKDAGRSFSLAQVATDYDAPTNADTGSSGLSGEVFRINSFPALGYDTTTDTLHVVWADDRYGSYDTAGHSVQTDLDVFLSSSRGGKVWSPLRTLGSGQDEVFPAVAAHGGKVAVSYYTRRYDPWDPRDASGEAHFGVGLDYAMTTVTGNGTGARGDMQRLTTQTSDPRVQFTQVGAVTGNLLSGVFIGDYSGIAVGTDGTAHPVWTDFRGNPGTTLPNQDVVGANVPLS